MRVVLVNQYFWPDMAATAQLLAELAEDLAAAGWQVTALTGRGSYARGREGVLPAHERYRGVEIRRVWCTDFGRGSMAGRLLDYATFMISAGLFVAFGGWRPREAVVVCLSTPPLVPLLGLLARWRGARFVYKVEDLYPDVAVALGTFRRGSLTARLLQRLSRLVLERASAVVGLDEGMRRTLLSRGARRVEVIRNWADGTALRPDPAAGEGCRNQLGLGDDFVVLYAGNMGLAHRFDAVVGAARLLAGAGEGAGNAGSASLGRGRRVRFLFVGNGPRLAEVERACAGLGGVTFLPYQPRERLPGVFNAVNVHLVTLRDEVAGLLVPSKIAAALACGKPVVLVGATQGTVAEELRRAGAGWSCPHEASTLAEVLAGLAADDAAVAAAGRRARELFAMGYDREQATGRWRALLMDVADNRSEGVRRA